MKSSGRAHQLGAALVQRMMEVPEEQQDLVTESDDIVYQPVVLRKDIGNRYRGNHVIRALDKTHGFDSLLENNRFRNSSFRRMRVQNASDSICKLLIVVTMYNEDVPEFLNTMQGIVSNLDTFSRYGVAPEEIACCVIVDGMKPFLDMVENPQREAARRYFSHYTNIDKVREQLQLQDPRKWKPENRDDLTEIGHIFIQDVMLPEVSDRHALQVFFTIKQLNLRKLNSHLWFFGGFCEELQPEFVVLLDVGTRPLPKSLFYLYEAMHLDPNLAGCCGEITILNFDFWKVVVPAQVVEYRFSHIFDKALESVVGYITVLPGAFSAYRWSALQGDPLWRDYFRSICHPEEVDPFTANIYLAEDRVLCLSLVSKAGCKFTLRYVRASVGETDVPETISGLMAQRRRWINGSWFALIDSLRNFRNIFESKHSCCRKTAFIMQMIYYYMNVVFAWFMVGSFFLVFAIAVRTEFPYKDDDSADVGNYIVLLYVILLMVVFVLSLAVHPSRIDDLFRGIAFIFGMYMFFSVGLVIYLVFFSGDIPFLSRLIISSTFIFFALNILVNCSLITTLKGILHFIYMTPTYVNIFLIFSICNIHDCSWGNRPQEMTAEEKESLEDFKAFRAKWCLVWLLSNASFGYVFNTLDKTEQGNFEYLMLISIFGGFILVVRTLFGIVYVCQEKCCKKRMKLLDVNEEQNLKNGTENQA